MQLLGVIVAGLISNQWNDIVFNSTCYSFRGDCMHYCLDGIGHDIDTYVHKLHVHYATYYVMQ